MCETSKVTEENPWRGLARRTVQPLFGLLLHTLPVPRPDFQPLVQYSDIIRTIRKEERESAKTGAGGNEWHGDGLAMTVAKRTAEGGGHFDRITRLPPSSGYLLKRSHL